MISNSVSDEFTEKENKVIAKIIKWERYQASLEEVFEINFKNRGGNWETCNAIKAAINGANHSGKLSLEAGKDKVSIIVDEHRARVELSSLLLTFRSV